MVATSKSYEEVLANIQQLDSATQRRLLLELMSLVGQESTPPAKRSIRELRGLGKEIWERIDAQEYVAQERSTWIK